jgi:dipeptidyl aminopeptidase/acylaminoacyl peptidase
MSTRIIFWFRLLLCTIITLTAAPTVLAEGLSPEALLSLKQVSSAVLSPNGKMIAYTIEVPRQANDDPGSAYAELHVYTPDTHESKPFVTGKVRVGSPAWSPDSRSIAFIMKRGDKSQAQVWAIRIDGGEATTITSSETGVQAFRWHPSGTSIGYLAEPPKTPRERALESRGYGFIMYEENLRPRTLYIAATDGSGTPRAVSHGMNVWSFEFAPDGGWVAVAASPRNLIDESYMSQKIYRMSLRDSTSSVIYSPAGKLGPFAVSPDGTRLAVAAAGKRSDNQVSHAFVVDLASGRVSTLTPDKFRGHTSWVGWKDDRTVLCRSGEGVDVTLATVRPDGSDRVVIMTSATTGFTFGAVSATPGSKGMAFVGQSVACPGDLCWWTPGENVERLTTLNPGLSKTEFGVQSVVRYTSRDGVPLEGILITPVGYEKGRKYPLLVVVHGGPEYHWSNSWVTSYGEPGQVFAAKGYTVFFPNYRSSTGYGVEFAASGLGDPAGREFDDIADGIDHLASVGIADRERIGLGGGSYGGYAAAWFATYYTRYVRAVVMFVGVSDLISRNGATDIPNEELFVHSGKPLEDMWELALKRSPIYWAKQSTTATLICGGADDPRVPPTQSVELYRRMKMNNHPAVRLVQYPGEQHGNARQPGRRDVLFRTLEWYDWYVRDAKPLGGLMPPLDISDRYGLEGLPAVPASGQ